MSKWFFFLCGWSACATLFGACGSRPPGHVDPLQPDPCAEVRCEAPPSPTCEGRHLRTYAPAGTCLEGSCTYEGTLVPCELGCEHGRCVGDACAGMRCEMPPPPACQGSDLLTYSSPGICTQGACEYQVTLTPCPLGCAAGNCLPDPCAQVLCDSPPPAYCLNPFNLRTFKTSGTCTQGTCDYLSEDLACAQGCVNGACQQPLDAGAHDAGAHDAGMVADGGPSPDGGVSSPQDAGAHDAGMVADGGLSPDGGVSTDGGTATPAGWTRSPDHCTGAFVQGNFRAAWLAPDGQRAFAAGSGGIFTSTNGGLSWSCAHPATDVHALWGLDANEVWAVGGRYPHPSVYRWQGTGWTRLSLPFGGELHAVWGLSPSEVHVVGVNAQHYAFDGSSWKSIFTSPNRYFLSMWGTSSTNYWVVGATDVGTAYVFRQKSTGGYGASRSYLKPLLGVHGYDPDNAWAVGTQGTIQRIVVDNLTAYPSPTTHTLRGVWSHDPMTALAVGDEGTILEFDGAAWNVVASPTQASLWSTSGAGPQLAVAAGKDGTLLRRGATGWTLQAQGSGAHLRAVSAADDHHAWALNHRAVLRWDGTQWQEALPGHYQALHARTPQDVWVGNHLGFHRWNGSGWQSFPSVSPKTVESIWARTDSDAWAVGEGIWHWDGATWSISQTGSFTAIHGVGPDEVWAVDHQGTVWKWNGTLWHPRSSGTTRRLASVWAHDANQVWAVGRDGTIVRSHQGSWAVVPSGTTQHLTFVWGDGTGRVWAAGESGTFLRWDGQAWAAAPGMPPEVKAVAPATSYFWGVGTEGLIVRAPR